MTFYLTVIFNSRAFESPWCKIGLQYRLLSYSAISVQFPGTATMGGFPTIYPWQFQPHRSREHTGAHCNSSFNNEKDSRKLGRGDGGILLSSKKCCIDASIHTRREIQYLLYKGLLSGPGARSVIESPCLYLCVSVIRVVIVYNVQSVRFFGLSL